MICYVAATDKMSWGRGTKEWEAVGHAIQHGGATVKKVILFEVKCPEGTAESQVSVNEMGSITAPAGSEVKEIATIADADMILKFFEFTSAVVCHLDDAEL